MSIVKSFSVGEGDTFYIKHVSDSFSIIDCNLVDDRRDEIIEELNEQSSDKNIIRFISTHPDEDHIYGLDSLDDSNSIINFYCVKNKVSKEEETVSFKRYCNLRDSDKAFYISKGCSRRWMNQSDDARGSAGINILWPDLNNEYFKKALKYAEDTGKPNNISPIISDSTGNIKIVWMGDLETEYMENVYKNVSLKDITVLFAPHHGRDSGKVPTDFLAKLNPKLIIIGEAPSKDLNYYKGYNTITQNSAGDITFDIDNSLIDIYVSNKEYSVDFLRNYKKNAFAYYLGTLEV